MTLLENTYKVQTFIQHHPNINHISIKEISDFYFQLIDCVVDHNHLYYVENKPILSDKEYDQLFDYLKKIEETHPEIITSNSPTQQLVGQVSEWFKSAQHKVKLLSLENSYNAEDLKQRDERIKKILEKNWNPDCTYIIEPKFDWISVELNYHEWKLFKAITRGDGVTWDDITTNVKTIKNIPLKLLTDESFAVRWEILMPKSVWKRLNKEKEELWDTPFANPRNAAAWSIKLLDSKEVERRDLACFVYDVLYYEWWKVSAQWLFTKQNLPIFPWKKECKNIEDVIKLCLDPETKQTFQNEDYDFDGIVIKVNENPIREILWQTEHHPRRAVAYKFPAQIVATQVNSVDFQVGRTGIITPVANLEPIALSWVTIKRVSLHNFDFISTKDIHIHDRIWLQRSGEVIPYIVSVIKDRRPHEAKKVNPPKLCPSCWEKVINEDIHYYCRNLYCVAQIKEKIIHFVSKNCMDIQWVGESIVDVLVENKIINNVADLYKLTDNSIQIQLMKLPWFGDRKTSEIWKQIEDSKSKPLRRLLNALWIPGVGKKTAQEIVKAMINNPNVILSPAKNGINSVKNINKSDTPHLIQSDTMKNLTNEEFLINIYWIGEKIVQSIIWFFHNKHNQKILERLENYGLNFDPNKYNDLNSLDESLWSFAITWSFPIHRDNIIQEFEKNWYTFHDQPSKNTNFILIWEKPWSKKVKAEELGIKIYEWRNTINKKFPFLKLVSTSLKPQAPSLF